MGKLATLASISERQPGLQHGAAWPALAQRQASAQRADALAHAAQAEPLAPAGLQPLAVVGDADAKLVRRLDRDGDRHMIGAGVAQRVGQSLLRDPIGGERGLFVQGGSGDIERHLNSRMALAPARRQHGERAGEAKLLQRGGAQSRQNAAVDLLQRGDLRVDPGAVRLEPIARGLAPQGADAGADREQKRADFVVQIARDVAALVLLHMDHASQQPVMLVVEPREARRQRVDPVGDGDKFRRAAARNAQGALAPLQPGEALGQRRDRRQRARHRDEDQSEGRQRDKPAANRQSDDLLPDFGDFVGGIGRDQQRAM